MAGTWERVASDGKVVERVIFHEDGTLEAVTDWPGWDWPRQTVLKGTYVVNSERMWIEGKRHEVGLDNQRFTTFESEFTYYASDEMFVRRALLYDHELGGDDYYVAEGERLRVTMRVDAADTGLDGGRNVAVWFEPSESVFAACGGDWTESSERFALDCWGIPYEIAWFEGIPTQARDERKTVADSWVTVLPDLSLRYARAR